MKTLSRIMVSVLGLGLSPKAPGTVTSIVVTPFLFFIYGGDSEWQFRLVLTLLTFLVAWIFVTIYTKNWGLKDHAEITIDELLGMQVTFLAGIGDSLENSTADRIIFAVIGLSLFRLFDIWKPWIVGWVDKNMKSNLGIILDDVVAGFLAMAGMQFIIALGRVI